MARFVHTWIPTECEKLMVENLNKNLVDQDEYPAAQNIHERCVVSKARAIIMTSRAEGRESGGEKVVVKGREEESEIRRRQPIGNRSSVAFLTTRSIPANCGRRSPTTQYR
jgi:hypothetical protein